MCVSGWVTSWLPAAPPPVTHCTRPAGRTSKTSMNFRVVRDVYSDGLMITAFPAATAAMASQQSSTSGVVERQDDDDDAHRLLDRVVHLPATAGPTT